MMCEHKSIVQFNADSACAHLILLEVGPELAGCLVVGIVIITVNGVLPIPPLLLLDPLARLNALLLLALSQPWHSSTCQLSPWTHTDRLQQGCAIKAMSKAMNLVPTLPSCSAPVKAPASISPADRIKAPGHVHL